MESRWYKILELLQGRVRETLGHEFETELTSRDFVGTGYTLREVLSAWLRVEMAHGRGQLVVKAGASTEHFMLTAKSLPKASSAQSEAVL